MRHMVLRPAYLAVRLSGKMLHQWNIGRADGTIAAPGAEKNSLQ
jgi:hypothetical protein